MKGVRNARYVELGEKQQYKVEWVAPIIDGLPMVVDKTLLFKEYSEAINLIKELKEDESCPNKYIKISIYEELFYEL